MGFKMRSGNGPLAFKTMGSSPAKQAANTGPSLTAEQLKVHKANLTHKSDLENTTGTTENDALIAKNKETADHTAKVAADKAAIDAKEASDKAASDKAAIEATRGTAKGQVKKSGRLANINKRQHKQYQIDAYDNRGFKDSLKSRKKWTAEQEASGNLKNQADWSASDLNKETKRETRLTKEVGMTSADYETNQTNKKAKFKEGMTKLAAGLREYGTGGSGSQQDGWKKHDALKDQKANDAINNEATRVNTIRRQQIIDANNEAELEELKLSGEGKVAVTSNGSASTDPNAQSSSEKALAAKNKKKRDYPIDE